MAAFKVYWHFITLSHKSICLAILYSTTATNAAASLYKFSQFEADSTESARMYILALSSVVLKMPVKGFPKQISSSIYSMKADWL